MATVKMGQIKVTLAKAIAYISRDDATNQGLYVSTNAAVVDPSDWRAVTDAMLATAERVGVNKPREGSVLAHHVIQSFDPSQKVSPEEAHRIGVDMAERITRGSHEYVIATHVDKDHVHNHIIFNAVNMDTGRKYRVKKDTIGRFRDMNDDLCRAAGIKTLEPMRKHAAGYSLGELYAVLRGESYKVRIRTEIDKATARAHSWDEFVGELRLAGIEVRQHRGETTYRDESANRSVRDWRLGEPYTEPSIMARLGRAEVSRLDFDESLVIRRTEEAVIVRVPGTGGGLHLAIPHEQIIQHGRTSRAYVPQEGRHVLANPAGTYSRTVQTAGLFEWFSRPNERALRSAESGQRPMVGVFNPSEMHTWRESLTALHQIEAQVNARARWSPDGSVSDALTTAMERVGELRIELSTQLVALSEMADTPDVDRSEVEALKQSLRGLDFRLDNAKRDVAVLTGMAQEPMAQQAPMATITEERRPTLQERIHSRAHELAERQEERQHTTQERAAQVSRTNEKEADFIRDREGGDGDGDDTRASGMSLRERIAQRMKPAGTGKHDDGRSHEGWRR